MHSGKSTDKMFFDDDQRSDISSNLSRENSSSNLSALKHNSIGSNTPQNPSANKGMNSNHSTNSKSTLNSIHSNKSPLSNSTKSENKGNTKNQNIKSNFFEEETLESNQMSKSGKSNGK
jgi:hypothetical protein